MIYFVTHPHHRYTLELFASEFNRRFGLLLGVQDYSIRPAEYATWGDTIIACDQERLRGPNLAQFYGCIREAESRRTRVLNAGADRLGRLEVLQTLSRAGVNPFNAYPADGVPDGVTFPVFCRSRFGHGGPISALINDADELATVLAELDCPSSMVIEYVDTRSSTDEPYHKYGAFFFDGTVVKRHCFAGSKWTVRNSGNCTERELKRERAYIFDPASHQSTIASACGIVGCQYGRVDYAVTSDGRICIFEINTNPTVIDEEDVKVGERQWLCDRFLVQAERALARIDAEGRVLSARYG